LRGKQKVKSGIWRDLAVRRRKTEVDHQIGLVAEIGARHGLPLPLTRAVVGMIHDLEEGRQQMSWTNIDALEDLRARMQAGQ
jgi:2-dehydropantoate 2-reductase